MVSHDRKDRLQACLEALERSEERESMEILVVDNGSSDGSALLETDYPNTRFIRLPRNFGLTKALNIGVRATVGEFIFFLHEDAEVLPDTARQLVTALEARSDATAAAPLLVDPAGSPAPQLGGLPPDDEFEPAETAEAPYDVLFPRGAAWMIRSFFIKGLGPIDEHYGQFGSDAEIAFQIRRAGKKVLLVPSARTIHHGRDVDSGFRAADRKLGRAVYIRKHYGALAGLKARMGSILGALSGFQLGQLKYLIPGQKIDGTQL